MKLNLENLDDAILADTIATARERIEVELYGHPTEDFDDPAVNERLRDFIEANFPHLLQKLPH